MEAFQVWMRVMWLVLAAWLTTPMVFCIGLGVLVGVAGFVWWMRREWKTAREGP